MINNIICNFFILFLIYIFFFGEEKGCTFNFGLKMNNIFENIKKEYILFFFFFKFSSIRY